MFQLTEAVLSLVAVAVVGVLQHWGGKNVKDLDESQCLLGFLGNDYLLDCLFYFMDSYSRLHYIKYVQYLLIHYFLFFHASDLQFTVKSFLRI